ncbi:Hypothetical predicted protein [Scomber scombrus]|uniref:Uncharacterized protein n=1 Tax=Scomber scombrus TaxID=13677 RepID=A0AAV1P813_SCOSC
MKQTPESTTAPKTSHDRSGATGVWQNLDNSKGFPEKPPKKKDPLPFGFWHSLENTAGFPKERPKEDTKQRHLVAEEWTQYYSIATGAFTLTFYLHEPEFIKTTGSWSPMDSHDCMKCNSTATNVIPTAAGIPTGNQTDLPTPIPTEGNVPKSGEIQRQATARETTSKVSLQMTKQFLSIGKATFKKRNS